MFKVGVDLQGELGPGWSKYFSPDEWAECCCGIAHPCNVTGEDGEPGRTNLSCGTEVMLEEGGNEAIFVGQGHPQLDSVEVARLLRRYFRVRNTCSRCHQIDLSGGDKLVAAHTVAVFYFPIKKPRHRLEPGVRVGSNVHAPGFRDQVGAKVIDEAIEQVNEGAEDAAELVMAAKDMVDRLTGWMEDTAEMQTESMLELADAIRDEMGSEQSEALYITIFQFVSGGAIRLSSENVLLLLS